MESDQKTLENQRKFIQHPQSIQIDVCKTNDSTAPHSEECNGLSFDSFTPYKKNEQININIDLGQMKFNGNAKIVWCRRKYKGFNIGVEFLESSCPFQVKMILQVCQIKDFIEHKERQEAVGNYTPKDNCKKSNDNALDWINKNAASF